MPTTGVLIAHLLKKRYQPCLEGDPETRRRGDFTLEEIYGADILAL
jgi:hypothetical protein